MKQSVTLHLSLIALVCLVLVSCGTPPTPTLVPTPTPVPISDFFKKQITRFLEEGTKLNAMTEQGVNYADFGQQLASAKGPYELASTAWPPGFATGAQDAIDHALEGWNLAIELWARNIDGLSGFREGIGLDYDRYASYEGDLVVIGDWDYSSETESWSVSHYT
jgi:hypothetical protein